MKKILLIILTLVLALSIGANVVVAQIGGGISSLQFLYLGDGVGLNPIDATWELGESGLRWAKGWFTDFDATTGTIGTLEITGSIDTGNLVIDTDHIEAVLVRQNDDAGDIFRVDTINSFVFSSTIAPFTDDGSALGTTTNTWSDAFFSIGAILNFGNGDVTITHSTDKLTIAGGDLDLGENSLSNIADLSVNDNFFVDSGFQITWDAGGPNDTAIESSGALQLKITDSSGNPGAILDATIITTSDKTFQFPNITGTLVTTAGAGANVDIGAFDLKALTITTPKIVTASGNLEIVPSTGSIINTLTDDRGNAFQINNSVLGYYIVDTRNTATGISVHKFDTEDQTLVAGSSSVPRLVEFTTFTTNYTGATPVTDLLTSVRFSARTLVGAVALAISKATSIEVVAPTESTDITLTDTSAIRVLNAGGTPINQYGIYIEDLTSGATLDYGLYIAGADTAGMIIASADPLKLGLAGAGTGQLQFVGTTSGLITIKSADAAGTYTLTLPTDDGDADQFLQTDGSGALVWAAAGGGATVVSVMPGPPGEWGLTPTANTAFNSNTSAHWLLVNFPAEITVNKISILTRADAIGTPSTFDIAVYSEDGQTKHIAVTSASMDTGNVMYSTAVSAVTLPAGNYYLAMIPNTDAFDGRFVNGITGAFTTYLNVSSEPVYLGTSTETAGTLPATFNPVTEITVGTGVNDSIPLMRFDN